MTDTLSLDRLTSALLVMDFQTAIIDGFAPDKEPLLARTARLVDTARAAGVMVLYVVVGFRPGYPEISERNLSFRSIKQTGRIAAGDSAATIHPAVAPLANEVVVTKHRVSAFAGTDLDMILRANGINTLLLAGISTSGVVLSTTRHAADADYRILIVKDCCADNDEEVHRVLTEKVFPRQATVTSSDVLIGLLE
jgi:nicotinamidase-related amidase